MSGPILVTGGSGTTASRIAARLTDIGAPFAVGTRRPAAPGQVRFDWSDPASAAAFEGFSSAYLVAPTDRTDHLPVMQPILERAVASGTRRFVLLSSSQLPRGGQMMGAVHAWLADHAPEWAVLRPSWFMQNFSHGPHARTIREENAIYSATGDGRVGFIDAGDIAAAAVALLTAERSPDCDFVLTGPEALSYDEVAGLISGLLSRRVRHVRLDTAELAKRHVALGLPTGYAQALAALDDGIREGGEARTTGDVALLTGEAPRAFRSFATDAAPLWL